MKNEDEKAFDAQIAHLLDAQEVGLEDDAIDVAEALGNLTDEELLAIGEDLPELTAEEIAEVERKANEKEKKRAILAVAIADHLSGPITGMLQRFGPELVLNGLMDMCAGLCSVSFPEAEVPGNLSQMAQRIMDTDWQRHRARTEPGPRKIVIAKPNIIIPR